MTDERASVSSYLMYGKEHAISGRDLAQLMGCDMRIVTARIAEERRHGKPICAETSGKCGYYLADSQEEIDSYCRRLKHRGGEMLEVARELDKIRVGTT